MEMQSSRPARSHKPRLSYENDDRLAILDSYSQALAACNATRSGYESAPCNVVRSEGRFELRDYPEMTVAEPLYWAKMPDRCGNQLIAPDKRFKIVRYPAAFPEIWL